MRRIAELAIAAAALRFFPHWRRDGRLEWIARTSGAQFRKARRTGGILSGVSGEIGRFSAQPSRHQAVEAKEEFYLTASMAFSQNFQLRHYNMPSPTLNLLNLLF